MRFCSQPSGRRSFFKRANCFGSVKGYRLQRFFYIIIHWKKTSCSIPILKFQFLHGCPLTGGSITQNQFLLVKKSHEMLTSLPEFVQINSLVVQVLLAVATAYESCIFDEHFHAFQLTRGIVKKNNFDQY